MTAVPAFYLWSISSLFYFILLFCIQIHNYCSTILPDCPNNVKMHSVQWAVLIMFAENRKVNVKPYSVHFKAICVDALFFSTLPMVQQSLIIQDSSTEGLWLTLPGITWNHLSSSSSLYVQIISLVFWFNSIFLVFQIT